LNGQLLFLGQLNVDEPHGVTAAQEADLPVLWGLWRAAGEEGGGRQERRAAGEEGVHIMSRMVSCRLHTHCISLKHSHAVTGTHRHRSCTYTHLPDDILDHTADARQAPVARVMQGHTDAKHCAAQGGVTCVAEL